jgi:hypothetical protein
VPRLTLPVLLTAALLLSACGGGGDDDTPSEAPTPTTAAVPFPKPGAQSLPQLRERYTEQAQFAPAISTLRKGENRVGFALFDAQQKSLDDHPTALYVAKPDGTGVRGPFTAKWESLKVKPQFESRQTAEDPEGTTGFYVAHVPFPTRGKVVLMALTQIEGGTYSSTGYALTVAKRVPTPPDVGDKAIDIHTLTGADVGGDLEKIDTRVPPLESLHKDDFADVLGKKPIVITFATPQLCQTRVCGPVVDVVEQVRAGTKADISFIHQEVYVDNKVAKGVREQLAAWHMTSEPWTYVIKRDGTIAQRFEGPVSVPELQAAVDAVES